ncbi:LamG-like jellyroll fold domain-containing protein [Blastococcus sp. SYSU D00669]
MSAATARAVRSGRRAGSAALAALLALGLLLLGLAVPTTASADTRPDPGVPPTVSADALPTVQVNGVVWSMVTVGNTVYATGSFNRARPAGSAPGQNETPRANLVAFNLTTGVMTSFNHTLNGQGRHITASPDGTRIYVAGDFTTVDGVARGHIAAFNTATGALINTFAPTSNGAIYSIAATNSTVYVGGNFTTAGGQSRTRLAAFNASNGAVTAWAPTANHTVRGMILDSTGQRVVFAGQFSQVNGQSAIALASVDLAGGNTDTWDYGITNSGDNGGVWSLKFDGVRAYATTYGYLVGNIEGVVAFDPTDLSLVWMNDCHGDPYDTWSNGTIVYNASHTHDCETSGGFPDPNPRAWKRAIAMTTAVTGTLKATTQVPRYGSWEGRPHPTVLNWWPTIPAGTYTGQDQGTWSVTGGGSYVAFGGEFPSVNGTVQQGLVRFATTNVAPNRRGPEITAGNLRPNASSNVAGEVKVTWPATWDMDNEYLTYRVFRGSGTTPVHEVTRKGQWWQTGVMTWTDTGRPAGSSASYRVTVSDPLGNVVTSSQGNTVTVAGTTSAYANQVLTDGAAQYWRLGETSGTTAYDSVALANMTERAGITRGTAGVLAGNAAITANGTATGIAQTTTTVATPTNAFSVEAWVRTASTAGGVIAQFGDSATGANTTSDRALYVDANGQVSFGLSRRVSGTTVYTNTVRSGTPITDGQWHHVVATVGAGGTALYVDGAQVAGNATMTSANTRLAAGYWMIGSGTLAPWANAPTSSSLNGALDEVAVYPTALTSAQVANHYSLATGATTNPSPTASFTATATGLGVAVDASASTDTAPGTVASFSFNWGDGTPATTGTSATAQHTYAAAGTYTITLTVTDNGGATGTTTRSVTLTDPSNTPPTAAFTATVNGNTVSTTSTSTDPNGTITNYVWQWGDGTPNTTGANATTATHTYAAPGTYTVRLTVTDNATATGTTTQSVTIAAPPVANFAADTFNRTVAAGGWGSADTGGAWTASAGATRLSVTPGAGVLDLPGAGNNTGAYLGGVSQAGADVTASFTLSSAPTGTGTDVYLTSRRMANGDEIRVRARVAPTGAITLTYSRRVGGVETLPAAGNVTVNGVTWTAGATLNVRVQTSTANGTTTTRAKVWLSTGTEPTGWQMTYGDATAAVQGSGGVGISAFRGSSTTAATQVRVTSFAARPVA